MPREKNMWVLTVIHSNKKADVYYRGDRENAEQLKIMHGNLYPKAKITLEFKCVNIPDKK